MDLCACSHTRSSLHLHVLSAVPSLQYKRNQIRKGMVLVATALNPKSCWEFEGDILVLHHPTTISCKYQAMGEPRSTGGGARMV